MLKDPFGWFPDPYFSTLLAVVVLATGFLDYGIPRILARQRTNGPLQRSDQGSFVMIQLVALVSVASAIFFRYIHWGVLPGGFQYLGLALMVAGNVIRNWAIIKLGSFFSRVVEIEKGHELITDGPYRWLRHPAYTGMDLVYLGFAFALGSWVGVLVSLVLVGGATAYRIRVEEKLLLQSFGNQYQEYMQRTWRLFPGW